MDELEFSTRFAIELLYDGIRTEGARDGGALRTDGLGVAIGLGSLNRRLDIEGQCRLSLEAKVSLRFSPDLSCLVRRGAGISLSLKASSPGVHSGVAAGKMAECEMLGRCWQKGVSPT